MKRAILFWFYKDPDICENRLRILRKYNPATKIYGLYGGDVHLAPLFFEKLNQYLDDFYCFTANADTHWKWRNGDLLLADWFRQRGVDLVWDSIVIVQWDMLILAPVDEIFASVPKGNILLSGTKPIADAGPWFWITEPREKMAYQAFLRHLQVNYDYRADPIFCIFIVVLLSREFLAAYALIENPELGFIEYRVPMYAQVFGIGICRDDRFVPSSPGHNVSEVVLTVGQPIPHENIAANMLKPLGARIFHPFHDYYA